MTGFDPRAFFTNDAAPPAPKHLGWALQDFDLERGWIRLSFEPKPEFCNLAGHIQGGFITAMLDDTLGPSVIIKAQRPVLIQTIDLHTHFLRPVKLGPVTAEAECTRLGRSIAFMDGRLFDAAGDLCARATSSARYSEFPDGRAKLSSDIRLEDTET